MFSLMRALVLPLAMILLAAPALAEPPGHAKKNHGSQSAKDYAPGHNKDKYDDEYESYNCGSIENDHERKRCRERHDSKYSSRDYDCGRLANSDARKRCNKDRHYKECDEIDRPGVRALCRAKYD